MADLSEILDVTEPVECQYMDRQIVAHVYTAGHRRLTKEDRLVISERIEKEDDGQNGDEERMSQSIDQARAMLPIILKAIDMDGTPLTVRGVPFPENVASLPDELLIEVAAIAVKKWNAANPTSGEDSPIGSPPPEIPEQNLTGSSIA